ERRAERRNADEVHRARTGLPDLVARSHAAADRLSNMGPFRSEQLEEERVAARAYFQKRAEFMELIHTHLEKKRTWDEKKHADTEAEVAEAQKRWYKAVRKR